jgi:hypothetical protein
VAIAWGDVCEDALAETFGLGARDALGAHPVSPSVTRSGARYRNPEPSTGNRKPVTGTDNRLRFSDTDLGYGYGLGSGSAPLAPRGA